jgi:hypothetical protein
MTETAYDRLESSLIYSFDTQQKDFVESSQGGRGNRVTASISGDCNVIRNILTVILQCVQLRCNLAIASRTSSGDQSWHSWHQRSGAITNATARFTGTRGVTRIQPGAQTLPCEPQFPRHHQHRSIGSPAPRDRFLPLPPLPAVLAAPRSPVRRFH